MRRFFWRKLGCGCSGIVLGLRLFGAGPAWAKSEIRSTVTPSTGVGVTLTDKWSAAAQFQLRLGGEKAPGYAIMLATQRRFGARFSAQIGYDALFGPFAMEGVTHGEQRGHLGLIGSTLQGSGRRLFVWSRTRLDFRALRREAEWQHSLRPRQELRVGWRIAPFVTLALGSEALVDPLQKGANMIQTRHRIMAYGQWSPRVRSRVTRLGSGENGREKWRLQWLIADTWTMHPLATSPVVSGVSGILGPDNTLGEPRERPKVIWHQLSFALSASF